MPRSGNLLRHSLRSAALHEALHQGEAKNLLHLRDLNWVDILLTTGGLDGFASTRFGGLDGLEVDLRFVNGSFGHDRDLIGDNADEALVDSEAADLAVDRQDDFAGGDDRGDGLVAGQMPMLPMAVGRVTLSAVPS